MTNPELSRTIAALLKAMSPTDLADTQATMHAELAARQPEFDLAEIRHDMAPARQAEWAAQILSKMREGQ